MVSRKCTAKSFAIGEQELKVYQHSCIKFVNIHSNDKDGCTRIELANVFSIGGPYKGYSQQYVYLSKHFAVYYKSDVDVYESMSNRMMLLECSDPSRAHTCDCTRLDNSTDNRKKVSSMSRVTLDGRAVLNAMKLRRDDWDDFLDDFIRYCNSFPNVDIMDAMDFSELDREKLFRMCDKENHYTNPRYKLLIPIVEVVSNLPLGIQVDYIAKYNNGSQLPPTLSDEALMVGALRL
jgi:hypothetical protein